MRSNIKTYLLVWEDEEQHKDLPASVRRMRSNINTYLLV
jgi:hypothetical protein